MKKERIKFFILFLILFSSFVIAADTSRPKIGMANPAAVYCKELGYEYKVFTEPDRSQHGECIFPDKAKCSGWGFYSGDCGLEHSYCAVNGYDYVVKKDGKNPYSKSYTVCVDKKSKQEVGSADKLMDLSSKVVRAPYVEEPVIMPKESVPTATNEIGEQKAEPVEESQGFFSRVKSLLLKTLFGGEG